MRLSTVAVVYLSRLGYTLVCEYTSRHPGNCRRSTRIYIIFGDAIIVRFHVRDTLGIIVRPAIESCGYTPVLGCGDELRSRTYR